MSDDDFAIVAEALLVVRGRTTILDHVSCTMATGQCTAILGPNGCGKTTLTRVLTGHVFLSGGVARVLGEVIGQTDIRALRKQVGIVNPTTDSASSHVSGAVVDADLSARDAVLTGFFATVGLYDRPTDAQRQRADQLLCEVGLADRRDLRFALLSTGEQRRCLIARALVHVPRLLILDEPTAGLDLAGREHVLATIESILAGPDPPAVLMITHHVEELSPRTAQVLLMKKGRFLAAGPPEQVITPESLTETFDTTVYVTRRNGRFWLEVLPEAWVELADRRETI